MSVGILTDRINNKFEKSTLINEHALNREPIPLNIIHCLSQHYRRSHINLRRTIQSQAIYTDVSHIYCCNHGGVTLRELLSAYDPWVLVDRRPSDSFVMK